MGNYTIFQMHVRKSWERQASKKFYNKCSENSRSQIVFRTDIFRKLTLGAPDLQLFGHPGATRVCSKLLGLQQYSTENFRCNLTLYESENFSNSSLHRIFESENFKFPFQYDNSLTWEVKCEKLNFRKQQRTYWKSFGHIAVFSRPQVIENSRQYLLLRTDTLQRTVVGYPCLCGEKTVYIKTHKTAINRPVDYTGET